MTSITQDQEPQQLKNIATPHEHDVLCGRGNFVNYHAGNEHFRSLVKKHKEQYVLCPKPEKAKFSRLIVDEIRSMNPPGRFLKQEPTTKLWHDIGDKKSLDKTRQALREGAPELMKELQEEETRPSLEPEFVSSSHPGAQYHLEQHQTLSSRHGHAAVVHGQNLSMPPNRRVELDDLSSTIRTSNVVPEQVLSNDQYGHFAGQTVFGQVLSDDLEPTPINPRRSMQHLRAMNQESAEIAARQTQEQKIHRSDSIDFDDLVKAPQKSSRSVVGGMGASSGIMSLSIGDLDESGLSAVFNESLRIQNEESKKELNSNDSRGASKRTLKSERSQDVSMKSMGLSGAGLSGAGLSGADFSLAGHGLSISDPDNLFNSSQMSFRTDEKNA